MMLPLEFSCFIAYPSIYDSQIRLVYEAVRRNKYYCLSLWSYFNKNVFSEKTNYFQLIQPC